MSNVYKIDYEAMRRVLRGSAKFARSPEVRDRLIKEAEEKRARKNVKCRRDYFYCLDSNDCLSWPNRRAKLSAIAKKLNFSL